MAMPSSRGRKHDHLQPTSLLFTSCFSHCLLLLGLFFVNITSQCVSLGLDTFLSSLASSLGLCTLGVHFFLEDPLTLFLGLSLVDVFDQRTLVLEGVTFAQLVEFMVKVFVDLARSTVFDEKTSENTQASHPEDLARHSRILCTLSLTEASVSTNSSGGVQLSSTGSRVHGNWLADDEAIAHQFSDGLARVCIGDLLDLVRVEPDLAFAAADDGRREALLCSKVHHLDARMVESSDVGWR